MLHQQVENNKRRIDVDFRKQEERLNTTGVQRVIVAALAEDLATLRAEVNTLLEDVAVEKASGLEKTERIGRPLSRLENATRPSTEVLDLNRSPIPVGGPTGGSLGNDDDSDSENVRSGRRASNCRGGRPSKKENGKKPQNNKMYGSSSDSNSENGSAQNSDEESSGAESEVSTDETDGRKAGALGRRGIGISDPQSLR